MERLGDFLDSYQQGMLSRIYLAQQLAERIKEAFPEAGEVKVVLRAKSIFLNARTPAAAKFLDLQRPKINRILQQLTKQKAPGFTLKIRVNY